MTFRAVFIHAIALLPDAGAFHVFCILIFLVRL